MSWRLLISRKVKRQIAACCDYDVDRIEAVVEQIADLASDPFWIHGEPDTHQPLQQKWNHRAWRIHVGGKTDETPKGWRCVYTVNERTRTVRVFRVAEHADAYRVRPKRYGNPRYMVCAE